jgi:hypothetical protein
MFIDETVLAVRGPAQRSTRTSMQPILSRTFEEHTSGASSADTVTVSVVQKAKPSVHTRAELLELPLSCNHRAILLLLFLLSDPEIDRRPAVGSFSELQILPVAIALVNAVHEDVHRDARRDELVGREVHRERLRLARNRDKGFDEAISVDCSELLQLSLAVC